ncbi:MAG: hypothetical protein KAW51_01670 [Candidatus Lokiarchaeota archaeon]|nr:hypothetical protein [Candidatus Lokiarchaeota archaeon]
MSNLVLTHSTKSESFYHKAIKRLMFKYISENSKNIVEKSLEKFIGNRRADVYFRMKSGKQIVVEVQNSNITVKEIIGRTEHYTKNGIHVLWILYGQGTCVASPKFPEDKKNVKISMVENFLHGMYGGRVYYVNINFHKDKTTISVPFALHFSLSSIKKYQKVFRSKFESYYIKNVNFTKIPSWDLLCVKYNDFNIARFYDKYVKRVLKDKISTFLKEKKDRNCNNCRIKFKNLRKCDVTKSCRFRYYKDIKLIKLILVNFSNKYGKPIITESLFELIKERKLNIDKKSI